MIISPSILNADFKTLHDDISSLEEAGLSWLHFDVMDGHFVPNISFGSCVVSNMSKYHPNLINDVHLMISDPRKYYPDFVKAGATYITFHYEAMKDDEDVKNLIDEMHQAGVKVGLSIKPNTDVRKLIPFLADLDLVLIMSVEPGFGGQKFNKDSLAKIYYLKDYLNEHKECHFYVEVDGGINDETALLVKVVGCDIVVAGTYIFGHEDFVERYKKIQ